MTPRGPAPAHHFVKLVCAAERELRRSWNHHGTIPAPLGGPTARVGFAIEDRRDLTEGPVRNSGPYSFWRSRIGFALMANQLGTVGLVTSAGREGGRT